MRYHGYASTYRPFLEIKSRKTNQTKFIDNIKDSLLKRIEDSSE
ncbi:RteC domain-containing protein [Winogradskyella sp. PC D3.3]